MTEQQWPICTVGAQHFCHTCRDRAGGQAFRETAAAAYDIGERDFACPKDKAWHDGDPPPGAGPGDHLHTLLAARFGIKPCQRCHEVIHRMNAAGIDGCRAIKHEVIDDIWTRRNALRGWRALAVRLPGAEAIAKRELGRLYDQAVEAARLQGDA